MVFLVHNEFIRWGPVIHIYVVKLYHLCSGISVLSIQHQTITWTNTAVIWNHRNKPVKFQHQNAQFFSLTKMLSTKCRLFCPRANDLNIQCTFHWSLTYPYAGRLQCSIHISNHIIWNWNGVISNCLFILNKMFVLNHLSLVMHFWVIELGHHSSRKWTVVCSTPSHHLNQSELAS